LQNYRWPGNVHELENAIERAVVVARGDTPRFEELPGEVRELKPALAPPEALLDAVDSAVNVLFVLARNDEDLKIMPAVERELNIRAMAETGGNQLKAAKLLEITRATLRKRLQKFNIERRVEVR
jgi:two-component system nitrogen regulation response regulator GlnG